MCLESDKLYDKRPFYVIFGIFFLLFYIPIMIAYPISEAIHTGGNGWYILWVICSLITFSVIVLLAKSSYDSEERERLLPL